MFLSDDFLLTNDYGKKLFHDYAKQQPIVDYHSHLEAKVIYDNQAFEDLTQIWLFDKGAGDHYKWRLLRTQGFDEALITGDAPSYEKYLAFVKALQKAVGNPIYEWSHLELRRYFGITEQITEANAQVIWDKANQQLASDNFNPKALIKAMKVESLATTDDPIDDLAYHKLLMAESEANGFKVYPTFRPDGVMAIDSADYKTYISRLSQVSGIEVSDFDSLVDALKARVAYFDSVGGCLSDHGLNSFYYRPTSLEDANHYVKQALSGNDLTSEQVVGYQSALQLALMAIYVEFGWTMQMHMNVIRNGSSQGLETVGINAGFDSMGVQTGLAGEVVALFSDAQRHNALPRIILYSLNPSDWLPLATAMQTFQGDMVQKIQLGSGWWFNDTRSGMIQQITTMAEQSLLGNFVGMLTDSRSLLSYPRHEYFRRILCDVLGGYVERGQLPAADDFLGDIVIDIAYRNAKTQLKF